MYFFSVVLVCVVGPWRLKFSCFLRVIRGHAGGCFDAIDRGIITWDMYYKKKCVHGGEVACSTRATRHNPWLSSDHILRTNTDMREAVGRQQ